jgi:hypothetical protein
MIKNRNLFIVIALLAIIGVSLYIRSYYIRTEGEYLLAFDPYYHYRMADTILDQGTRPEWDIIAAHPTGAPVRHPPLYHYYLAYTYRIVNIFSDMTLFQWCIYANIPIIIITVVAAFFAGKVLTNDVGGLFTALFMGVNGAISSRTVIGYTDTDICIIFFSFAVFYFLFSALKSEKNYWSVLLGFSLFLFGLTWRGHWHVPLLVFSSLIIYMAVSAFKKQLNNPLLSAFAVSFLSFLLPWTLYRGYYTTGVIVAVVGVLWVVGEKFAPARTQWIPALSAVTLGITALVFYGENVFSTVARDAGALLGTLSESQETIIPDISVSILQRSEVTLSAMGRLFSLLLLVAPFGIIYLLWKRDKFSLQVMVYLALYFLGTGFLMFMGGRYTMLFAVPLILAAGAFFGALPEILENKVTYKGSVVVILICALSVVPCYVTGSQTSKATSAMNDDLWEVLTWASQNTPEDAVIISGWDTGYWIESIGERRSVMNGGHYDIIWRVVKYGKLVETQDETVAVKEVYGFADEAEVRSLRDYPEGSSRLLEMEIGGFAEDNAYVLVSEWTLLTFYWLSYFGNWNYVTGEAEGRVYNPMWAQDARKLFGSTEYLYGDQSITFSVIKEEGDYHSFILDKSGYVPTQGTLFSKDGQMYFLKRETGEFGVIYVPPESIAFFETELTWPDAPSEVFFIKKEDLQCMLTRLYFFNGEGLHYFELVKDGGTAKLFKVHTVAQEFSQGVITEEDTYEPI